MKSLIGREYCFRPFFSNLIQKRRFGKEEKNAVALVALSFLVMLVILTLHFTFYLLFYIFIFPIAKKKSN